MISIRNYSNYRTYLKDWFDEKKKTHPAFSLRSLSKRGRAVPHSTFWMVMRGQRNLTPTSVKQFVSILGLSELDAKYFEILVMFNQAKGWVPKQRQLERILEMRVAHSDSEVRLLTTKVELNLYSSWYTLPIFVMLEFEDFKIDPEWVSKKLGATVSEGQIRSVLDQLLVAGLVSIEKGRPIRKQSQLHMDTKSILPHVERDHSPPEYFVNMSQRAALASRFPSSETTGAAGTIMASRDDLPLVRQHMYEALTEITALIETRDGPKELYQLSSCFFPLARTAPLDIATKSRMKSRK